MMTQNETLRNHQIQRGFILCTSFHVSSCYVINMFNPKQQMSTSQHCERKCQQVTKVNELLSEGTTNVWAQICGDRSNRSWDVSTNEGNRLFVLICAVSMRGQILVTAQTTGPSTALRAACLTWLFEGLHLMWWMSSWWFWHRGIISQVSERLRLNGPFVSVRINEFAFVSAYVSILCVPLILGMLAYSSNQADVRDLFWMPAATAGQQQQQQQGEGMPSVRRPGQSDRWSCRRKRRWRLSCFMGCGGERGVRRERGSWTGDMTLMRDERESGGGGGGGGGGVVVEGSWRHLVWCQSSQLSGMPHSRRSTPRCFLSPPNPHPPTQQPTPNHRLSFLIE